MKLKKILIGIIFVLAFVIISCLSLVFKKRYDLKVADSFENQTIANVETQENLEESIIPEDEIIENETTEIAEQPIMEENQEISSTPPVTQNIAQEKTYSIKQSTQSTSNSQSPSTKQESTTQTQTQVETNTTIPITQEQTKVTEEKTEIATTPSPSAQVVTKDEEKYIRNDAMINKIREVINNNPSEYMNTYGYEVVVDSSIKEHSNQFTFTETRVKAYITYRFGTIKIYAEDYYRNGQLIMTECYIY